MLNPNLDLESLTAQFARQKRIQIAEALEADAAEALLDCLEQQVQWTTAHIGKTGPAYLSREQFQRLGQVERQEFLRDINERARQEFQYLYDSYPMVRAYKEGRDPGLLLHQVLEYLNAPPFLDFARAVTGIAPIYKVDGQATRYLSGHFLKHHNDTNADENRLVAYVLNLTRKWRADWGGLLQFMDADGRVIETYMPRFNTLTLFQVPAWHCVSYVAPFAQAPRYAITGWFRAR